MFWVERKPLLYDAFAHFHVEIPPGDGLSTLFVDVTLHGKTPLTNLNDRRSNHRFARAASRRAVLSRVVKDQLVVLCDVLARYAA